MECVPFEKNSVILSKFEKAIYRISLRAWKTFGMGFDPLKLFKNNECNFCQVLFGFSFKENLY